MRIQFLTPLLPALVGVALGLIAYTAPAGNTGVDGTFGALLALIGALATAIGILLLAMPALRHSLFTVMTVLVFLGAGLTALAAYFLTQIIFAIAMVATLLALVFTLTYSPRRRAA